MGIGGHVVPALGVLCTLNGCNFAEDYPKEWSLPAQLGNACVGLNGTFANIGEPTQAGRPTFSLQQLIFTQGIPGADADRIALAYGAADGVLVVRALDSTGTVRADTRFSYEDGTLLCDANKAELTTPDRPGGTGEQVAAVLHFEHVALQRSVDGSLVAQRFNTNVDMAMIIVPIARTEVTLYRYRAVAPSQGAP